VVDGATIDEAVAEARQSLAGAAGAWSVPVLLRSTAPPAFVGSPRTLGPEDNPHNLPGMDRRLISRERESTDLLRLVSKEGNRLVTITGAGGIGKSRLSLHVGKQLLFDFPDGVWMVECEIVAGRDELYATIAAAVGLHRFEGSAQEALFAYLRDRRLLLLLDCYEGLQVAGEAGAIERLLEAAPQVSAIVTSRSILGLASEVTYPLQSLGFDEQDPESGSVRLFFEFAAVNGKITVQDRQLASQICCLLEGVPLAIILAASRIPILSLAELLELIKKSACHCCTEGLEVLARLSRSLCP